MILVNGRYHAATHADFDVTDRGLLFGDGVQSTMLVTGGSAFMLASHLDRMAAGFDVLGFAVDRHRLEHDVAEMAARAADGRGILRLTVTRGAGARGLLPPVGPKPSVIVALFPWVAGAVMEPTTLATVSIRRNEYSPLSRIRSLSALDNVLALREAVSHGARDGLLLNTAGRVASSTLANLFAVIAGELVTPPLADGVHDGVIRELLLEHASDLGLSPVERSIEPVELAGADAVFLTGATRFAQPVTRLDGRPLRGDLAALFARSRRLMSMLRGPYGWSG